MSRPSRAAEAAAPSPGEVLCLGPRSPAHYFANDGTPGNRVCDRCRRAQDVLNLSLRQVEGTPIQMGEGLYLPSPD